MDRTISLTNEQVALLEQLLTSSKETPAEQARRERAEMIDSEIYSLDEVHQRLLSVVDSVIPDTDDGKIIKPILEEWLGLALQAQVGRKMIERDIIMAYNDDQVGEAMEQEMMLDNAGDWMSFFARRAKEAADNEQKEVDEQPGDLENNFTEDAPLSIWVKNDSFSVALVGIIGGLLTGILGTALTLTLMAR